MGVSIKPPLVCAMFGAALPAHADKMSLSDAPIHQPIVLDCDFVTECYEAEPCQDTRFSVTLEGQASGFEDVNLLVEVRMRSDAADVPLMGNRSNGALALAGGIDGVRHMVTTNADGTARYTVHDADGPMMVSYLGSCAPQP
ncbi:hypothetical protein GGQ68_001624 [Sagittula marina]|uniref:Uncharacterized protein n=1 Tax=Sagittula marina TaxID=943940 RepID=A0A7W6GRV1_9RHOB|nr:hypothetical protein [Sagittula marina]MBB3985295.1 hypothetical protein [Sagittula marina]